MPAQRPLLILISGAPGTGKTTLAGRLSESLALPLLAKDTFRKILADAFEARTVEQSRALVPATLAIYYTVIDQLLAASVGVIAECNFHRGVSEHDLRPLVARARTVLVHCQTAREVSVRRFVDRYERGSDEDRRWSFDEQYLTRLRAGESLDAWERAEPLALGVPTLIVDTTDGYEPDFERLVAFVRAAGARTAG